MVFKIQGKRFYLKKYYVACVIITVVLLFTIITLVEEDKKLYGINTQTTTTTVPTILNSKYINKSTNNKELINGDLFKNSEYRTKLLKDKVARLERKFNKSRSILLNSKPILQPNYNVHIFYYSWYRNVAVDGSYRHWNHRYLENWKHDDHHIYPTGTHSPPNDIGSNYYPKLGCYSSSDPQTVDWHMQLIREAGIGVVVVSWMPKNFTESDANLLPLIFEKASKHKLKVALHVEPYPGRNPINLRDHLRQFLHEYGNHLALYRIKKPLTNKQVPVVYIYDSYLIPDQAWRELLSIKGNLSVRDTDLDAIYLGLLVDDKYHIKKSQFDGFYTYFATNSFTYGSTWKNWFNLSKFAVQNGLIFVPSVGPGYADTRVRPWNGPNTRIRRHGHYYDVGWRSAINNNANYVSITSFNEWHEGTQIEPAIPYNADGFTYLDYQPEGPFYYLNLTKVWVEEFSKVK